MKRDKKTGIHPGGLASRAEAKMPFLVIAAAFCAGIILASKIMFSFWFVALGLFILGLGVGFLRLPYQAICVSLLAIFFLLGCLHVKAARFIGQDSIEDISKYYYKKPIVARGVIISDVQHRRYFAKREKTEFVLRVEAVRSPWGWQEKNGRLKVVIFREAPVAYGDRIEITGRLHRPFKIGTGGSSYRDFLSRQGIRWVCSIKKNTPLLVLKRRQGNIVRQAALKARKRLDGELERYLSPEESGVMAAVLLGDRGRISRPMRDLFAQTGTAHILAISGLHVGIVAGLLMLLLRVLPLGRGWRAVSLILLLGCYGFMTGGRPSVIRAIVMLIVYIAGGVIERKQNMLNTVCLAAFILLLVNPLWIFDAGFQMSFVCVFSIILITPLVEQGMVALRVFQDKGVKAYFLRSLCLSFSLWVGLLGLIVYYFQMVTPIAILANIIVVPLVALVVALGFGLLGVSLVLPGMAGAFAACLRLALNGMVALIFLMHQVPGAYVLTGPVEGKIVGGYYVILIGILFVLRRRKDREAELFF